MLVALLLVWRGRGHKGNMQPQHSRHKSNASDLLVVLPQVGYMVAAGMLHRLANVFSLFDQPVKDAARPVPPHVLQVGHQLHLRVQSLYAGLDAVQ